MEEPYTKREMDDHFEVINCKLDEINDHVKTTNGRVKRLELWRAGIVGAIGVISGIVIPLIMYIYLTEMPQQVQQAVAEALSKYEIIIEQ